MNHTCYPKKDHLPYWARRDNKITKGDRVELFTGLGRHRLNREYVQDVNCRRNSKAAPSLIKG